MAGRAGGSIAAREQEDAQEWLTFILDQAHTELLRLRTQHAARLGQLGANSNERPEQTEALSVFAERHLGAGFWFTVPVASLGSLWLFLW